MGMAHESLPQKLQILCKQMCSHVKDAGMFYTQEKGIPRYTGINPNLKEQKIIFSAIAT